MAVPTPGTTTDDLVARAPNRHLHLVRGSTAPAFRLLGSATPRVPAVLVFPSVHGFKQFLKATATGAIEEWTDALGSYVNNYGAC